MGYREKEQGSAATFEGRQYQLYDLGMSKVSVYRWSTVSTDALYPPVYLVLPSIAHEGQGPLPVKIPRYTNTTREIWSSVRESVTYHSPQFTTFAFFSTCVTRGIGIS